MHNSSQWPDLRYLGEPLGGAEGLLEAVSFKKATTDNKLVPKERRENVWECGNSDRSGGKAGCMSGAESVMGQRGKLNFYALLNRKACVVKKLFTHLLDPFDP